MDKLTKPPENCATCETAITKGYSTRSCARPAIGYITNWRPDKQPICKQHWDAIKKERERER